MKYRIVDADNRAEYSKPKSLKRSKRGLNQTQSLKRHLKMNLALNWMHKKLNIAFSKSRF